jgi:hypothetical protein
MKKLMQRIFEWIVRLFEPRRDLDLEKFERIERLPLSVRRSRDIWP